MLEPESRELLLDMLRPPDGCEVVHAVGTTYSLDLQALLFAPLAFAMFDWAIEDDGRPNPIALLEALRRNSERTTVFCQAGQIGLSDYQPLMIHLEQSVVPVTPPGADFIFHPKLWVLRFRPSDGGRDRYRVLCLTRNLTFDTSWDTACVLEGERRKGGDTVAQNRPLCDFLTALTELGGKLDARRRDAILDLVDDIADVRFEAPEGFDSVRFRPVGLAGGGWPFIDAPRRVFVMSPFLTAGALSRLGGSAEDNVLVSRQEMLDAVGRRGMDAFGTVYVLNQIADQPDTLEADEGDPERDVEGAPKLNEAQGDAVDVELRGIHAKLFVLETDQDVRFYTGSANATDAAFGGNVEFLVELRIRQDGVGIDALLALEEGVTTLRAMLEEYVPPDQPDVDDSDAQKLERVLDRARRKLGAFRFTATLDPAGDDGFELALTGQGEIELPDEIVAVHCWPISRGQGHQVTPRFDDGEVSAAFGRISEAGITSFFAFELRAQAGSTTDVIRFVVNADLEGAPEGRTERVITQILRDRQDVLRYLLFLLADLSGGYAALMDFLEAIGDGSRRERPLGEFEPPLFETLVRAVSRDPARLDHIHRLMQDLAESGRVEDLVPEGLELIWEPIWEVREELAP